MLARRKPDELDFPWEFLIILVSAFLLSALGLLWSYGNHYWSGEKNTKTLQALYAFVAGMGVFFVVCRISFRRILVHGQYIVFCVMALAVASVLRRELVASPGSRMFALSLDATSSVVLFLTVMTLPLFMVMGLAMPVGSRCTGPFAAVESSDQCYLFCMSLSVGVAFAVFAGAQEVKAVPVICLLLVFAMAWTAGLGWGYTILLFMIFSIYFMYAGFSSSSYWPGWRVPLAAWQPHMTAIASFAYGGWLGGGLGNSLWPEPLPDHFYDTFVFSMIGQELGVVGSVAVVVLYLAFAVAGFRLAAERCTTAGRMYIFGMVLAVTVTALCHMGSCTGLLPAARSPVPFLNGGLPGIVLSWAGLGLIGSALQYDLAQERRSHELLPFVYAASPFWVSGRAVVIRFVLVTVFAFLLCQLAQLGYDKELAKQYQRVLSGSNCDTIELDERSEPPALRRVQPFFPEEPWPPPAVFTRVPPCPECPNAFFLFSGIG